MFENKKIFVLGMARSGYEAAKVLAKHNNQVLITDCKPQDEAHLKILEELGVQFVMTDHPEDYLDDTYDYVVKNPGISYEHSVVLKANSLQIPVTNEVEVAYSFLPKNVKIVAITGSNGKTTTTTLTYLFLKEMGLSVHIGGNIGFPLCSIIEKVKENDVLVLEISGHQQHDFIHFKADIVIMTNLSEVHLDFFKTYENYKYHKSFLLRNQTKEDVAILNLENEDVKEVSRDILSRKLYFSSQQNADSTLKDGAIYYKEDKVVDCDEIKIKGIHNYENIMCAILAAKEFGIKDETIRKVLKEFNGVEHRIEFVRTLNGVDYYNDSKSTNVKSTQIALNTFSQPTILLLGGLDRGHSFEELTPYLKNVFEIICYGETKNRIKEYADSINKKCIVKETLKDAILKAHQDASKGTVVLLSPACASWDQYKNFEERGNEFKNIVNSL